MYKYRGGGFLVGVPTRNLTDDEARLLGIPRLVRSGLYEYIEPERKTKAEIKTEQPAEKPGIFRTRKKG